LKAPGMLTFEEANKKIWDIKAEIFIPGAASRLVTKDQIDRMVAGGLEVISCGANVPFADPEIFMGETAEYADSKVSVIPDFIANCGMARVFGYLMTKDAELTDEAIFNDVSKTIQNALKEVYADSASTQNISSAALKIALNKLL
jgi:glutamate dehydrogenase/leucine dehydrogenase